MVHTLLQLLLLSLSTLAAPPCVDAVASSGPGRPCPRLPEPHPNRDALGHNVHVTLDNAPGRANAAQPSQPQRCGGTVTDAVGRRSSSSTLLAAEAEVGVTVERLLDLVFADQVTQTQDYSPPEGWPPQQWAALAGTFRSSIHGGCVGGAAPLEAACSPEPIWDLRLSLYVHVRRCGASGAVVGWVAATP